MPGDGAGLEVYRATVVTAGDPENDGGGLYAKLIKQVGPTFSLRAYGYDYAQLEQEKLIATPKRTLLHEAMNSS